MYIVFTSPNQFVKDLNEACEIRDDYFNKTGEIVAVEMSQHHDTPWRTINNY